MYKTSTVQLDLWVNKTRKFHYNERADGIDDFSDDDASEHEDGSSFKIVKRGSNRYF